jgi:hypothetical protein
VKKGHGYGRSSLEFANADNNNEWIAGLKMGFFSSLFLLVNLETLLKMTCPI